MPTSLGEETRLPDQAADTGQVQIRCEPSWPAPAGSTIRWQSMTAYETAPPGQSDEIGQGAEARAGRRAGHAGRARHAGEARQEAETESDSWSRADAEVVRQPDARRRRAMVPPIPGSAFWGWAGPLL